MATAVYDVVTDKGSYSLSVHYESLQTFREDSEHAGAYPRVSRWLEENQRPFRTLLLRLCYTGLDGAPDVCIRDETEMEIDPPLDMELDEIPVCFALE